MIEPARWERRLERGARVGALLLAAIGGLLGCRALRGEAALCPPGLELRLVDPLGRFIWTRPWREADLTSLSYARGVPAPPWRAELQGYWDVPASGRYRLVIKSEGLFQLRVCGHDILARATSNRDPRSEGDADVQAGPCPIVVSYTPVGSETMLRLRAGRAGERPTPLDPDRLYSSARVLAEATRRSALRGLRLLAVGALVASLFLGCAVLVLVRRRTGVWPRCFALTALPIALTLLAGALRFEAVVGQYWLQDAPTWAWRVSETIGSLRPWNAAWNPRRFAYGGDPGRYLDFARESYRFYDAHVREPVFIFAARGLLRIVGDQPIAVNLAATLFSVLTVPALFVLGRVAFSSAAGATAAGLFAIEQHVVGSSVEGWRDEAFTFFVVASAGALVWLYRRGEVRAGILVGVLGGLACLTRITSLSFLLPGLALAALCASGPDRRARLLSTSVALVLVLAILAPFLATCWITYDDPFISINAHTRFYRARQGVTDFKGHQSWGEYLRSMHTPMGLLDKGLLGVTVYPFSNKWDGLEPFWGAAPFLASWLALLGLGGLLFSIAGRRLLVLLVASLVPFAFTWDVNGGGEWRFTEHAYPFYLIAVGCSLAALLNRGFWRDVRDHRSRAARRVAGALGAFSLLWAALVVVHKAQVLSELRGGKTARVLAGPQDGLVFAHGWARPRYEDGSWRRGALRDEASLALTVEAGRGYGLRLYGREHCSVGELGLGVRIGARPAGTVVLSDPRGPVRSTLRLPAALVESPSLAVTLVAPTCAAKEAFDLTRIEIVPL